MSSDNLTTLSPFNTPLEIGLRTLCLLTEAYPLPQSLNRLVVFDYLTIHSDDMPSGPAGLHPKTPYRSGELLVRRESLQKGLLLYHSRGLIARRYTAEGVFYSATESSASFLDSLQTEYTQLLRNRASWVVSEFNTYTDAELSSLVRDHIGVWGAEFEMESVLWAEGREPQ